MTDVEARELVMRAQRGDEVAAWRLALAHRDLVAVMATEFSPQLGRLDPGAGRDDLEQDFLAEMLESVIPRYDGRSSFRSWVRTRLRTVGTARVRKLIRRSKPRSSEMPVRNEEEEFEGTQEETARKLALEGARDRGTITHGQWLALTCRMLDGLSVSATAQVLGLARTTVQRRVHAAVAALEKERRGC